MNQIGTDPLLKTSDGAARALFEKFGAAADAFPADDAMTAAANIIINALRQSYDTREKALARFDEIFGRSKQILADQYTSAGRMKGVYPYDQVIVMPLLDARPKF